MFLGLAPESNPLREKVYLTHNNHIDIHYYFKRRQMSQNVNGLSVDDSISLKLTIFEIVGCILKHIFIRYYGQSCVDQIVLQCINCCVVFTRGVDKN